MPIANQPILPGETIGIIGGGQLGRMMVLAARYMGYRTAVLDPTPDAPAAQAADIQFTAEYDDINAVRQLADESDVVTYEFENVDVQAASMLHTMGKMPQGSKALEVTQNRENEKTIMYANDLPVAPFAVVHDETSCREALEDIGYPSVIKTLSGGYDGKGQEKLASAEDAETAIAFIQKHGSAIVEEWVSFDKEISVIFTRGRTKDKTEIVYFPIAENEHRDHVLYQTTVPADISESVQQSALHAAEVIAGKLDVIGTFAIEMFVSGDAVFLNEMAPRPHNSGHYTIEGCNISQFGQHVRAVCGLPLVPVRLLEPSAMVNILGAELTRLTDLMPQMESGSIHVYGKKDIKEKRKMGHITFTDQSEEALREKLKAYHFDMDTGE